MTGRAFADLAAAIDPRISTEAAADLIVRYRAEVLAEAGAALHQVWVMAPDSENAAGVNFAIGVLLAEQGKRGGKTTAPAKEAVRASVEDSTVRRALDDVADHWQIQNEIDTQGEYKLDPGWMLAELRRMAREGRTYSATAGEKTTAAAAAVTPEPEDIAGRVVQEYGAAGEYQRAAVIRDRIDDLLDHIRRYPDRTWTTAGVHAFYQDRAPKRATARRDLETLHAIGWLELHDDKGRRSYTLTQKDTRS